VLSRFLRKNHSANYGVFSPSFFLRVSSFLSNGFKTVTVRLKIAVAVRVAATDTVAVDSKVSIRNIKITNVILCWRLWLWRWWRWFWFWFIRWCSPFDSRRWPKVARRHHKRFIRG
jgi:hypothetical protein